MGQQDTGKVKYQFTYETGMFFKYHEIALVVARTKFRIFNFFMRKLTNDVRNSTFKIEVY